MAAWGEGVIFIILGLLALGISGVSIWALNKWCDKGKLWLIIVIVGGVLGILGALLVQWFV